MKLFITGNSGLVGTELIKHLSKKKEFEIVKYHLKDGNDILNYEQLKEAMKGCDVVIHLAAIRGPYEDKTFEDYFRVNCIGTFNVAQAALENRIKRFVFVSSTTYYGLEIGVPYVKPIKESNPIITQHLKADDLKCRDCDVAYSTSKVIGEQILANYGLRKKFEVVILRFGPIGPKLGERWKLNGITLKIENAVKALELAITTKKKLWYEAFTITDDVPNVNLSKAKKILGYNPI
ncbi:MAG: NAD-dependent epimerase/dehydratase family protein [Nitrospiraceae bacterium]|nr:NAD-dependent epimerase/dehydratase family protein [Nitrospiraceae bacterium]